MKTISYIVVNRNGILRCTKRAPDLARTEVAIKLALTIPDACFRAPEISASLDVPEDQVMQPSISVEAVALTEEGKAVQALFGGGGI